MSKMSKMWTTSTMSTMSTCQQTPTPFHPQIVDHNCYLDNVYLNPQGQLKKYSLQATTFTVFQLDMTWCQLYFFWWVCDCTVRCEDYLLTVGDILILMQPCQWFIILILMQSHGLMSLHPLCSLSSVFILVYLQIFQKESCEKNTQTWRNSKSTVWHSLKIEAIFFTVETFISIQQYPLLNLLFTDASIDL